MRILSSYGHVSPAGQPAAASEVVWAPVAVVHLTEHFGDVHIAGCERRGAAYDPDRKTAAAIFP